MKNFKLFISTILISSSLIFTSFAGKWVDDETGRKYQNDDGTFHTSSKKTIDGVSYHFNYDGYIEPGWFSQADSWYYANPDGAIVEDSFIEENGINYYLNSRGSVSGYSINDTNVQMIAQNSSYAPGCYVCPKEFTTEFISDKRKVIPAGEYIAVFDGSPRGSCLIRFDDNTTFSSSSMLVSVKEGDSITFKSCHLVPLGSFALDITQPGMFLVGRDIKAGTYNLNNLSLGGYTIRRSALSSDDSSASDGNIISSGFAKNASTITVTDGQYIHLEKCTANFVAP